MNTVVLRGLAAAALCVLLGAPASAAVIALTPAKDATIYGASTSATINGVDAQVWAEPNTLPTANVLLKSWT